MGDSIGKCLYTQLMYIIKFNNNTLHNVNYFFVALRYQNRITSSQLNIMTTHKSNKKKKAFDIHPFKKKRKKKAFNIHPF